MEVIFQIIISSVFVVAAGRFLYGMTLEHDERRRRFMEGETDYYGNKIDE
ncbi:hypothetical protein N9H77_01465 [Porticoccaceae bacterium]|nr:hypothetical protein [Porticoccaceae bacterium]MDB4559113.1 hypothetical protein [bacterium]